MFPIKKQSLFRTLPVRQTSYDFILVLAIICIFKDNILIYICSNLHICSIYLLFYLSIYVYICTSKDKVLVYIYVYNSKDKVLDYICFLFKKNVPVQDTACSADQLRFRRGLSYSIYFQGQHPSIHLQQFTYLQYLTTSISIYLSIYLSIYIYMYMYLQGQSPGIYI